MCRSHEEGYRRCQNPEALSRQNITQLQLRHVNKYIAAEIAGDTKAAAHHLERMNEAEKRLEIHLEAIQRAKQGASVASEYTPVTTATLSDFELAQRRRDLAGDPEAVDAITRIMQWRAEQDGDIEQIVEDELIAQTDFGATPSWEISTNPLHTPTRTTYRRLDPEQQCREDYDNYVYNQYLRAEDECAGVMVNARGRARGIEPIDMFRGNTKMAQAYASDELKTWFRENGRLTLAAFRHAYFNRDSDYAAAVHCRTTGAFDDAA